MSLQGGLISRIPPLLNSATLCAFQSLGLLHNSPRFNYQELKSVHFRGSHSFPLGIKNDRYFSPAEKTKVIWGMIAINLAIQLLVVSVLHSLVFYYFVGSVGRTFAKQKAKRAAAGS